MAGLFFSELFAEASTPTTLDSQKRAPAGVSHGRKRYARAEVLTTATLTTDTAASQIRVKQFKSGDRIHKITVHNTADGGSGAVNMGLWKSGTAHDGAVVDADIFLAAQSVSGASAAGGIEGFTDGALDDFDRGKTLWELATVGAASYTSDPMEDWDVVITATATVATAQNYVVEFEYTSGD